MKIGILAFPHASYLEAIQSVMQQAGMQPMAFEAGLDGYVMLGDLSDDRCEVLSMLHSVLPILMAENALGKPILGMGQGAWLLVESGIVPGLENNKLAMAVVCDKENINQSSDLSLTANYQRNIFTKCLTIKNKLAILSQNNFARFVLSDALLNEIKSQGLNVMTGAIANKAGNAMAILPHIECDAIFQSMQKRFQHKEVVPLYYYPRQIKLTNYQHGEFNIADEKSINALQLLLNKLNIQLDIKTTSTKHMFIVQSKSDTKQPGVLWCFDGDANIIAQEIEKLLKSNVLYNPYSHDCFKHQAP